MTFSAPSARYHLNVCGKLRISVPSFLKTSLNRLRGQTIFDSSVEQTEQLFHAPPFTAGIADSLQLISTRLSLKPDEASRRLLEREANAASQNEYSALEPVLRQIPRVQRALEIGPGFGRSVVFFDKKQVWDRSAEIHLYDTNGSQTKYKQKYYDHPPKWPDTSSFCGNLELLRTILEYNGVKNYRVLDASEMPLAALPGPYDLIYGFYSIGYHWSLEFYLDDLQPLLHSKTLFVCTLNKHFRSFDRLREFSTRVVECREIKKGSAPLRLLLMGKSELPRVGMALEEAVGR